jgi:hypothetical protein
LRQRKIGQDKPTAYAGRPLNQAEQNYLTIDQEFTAIVWACIYFRPYLLGRTLTIVTIINHLPGCLKLKILLLDLRWRLLLQEYDYTIEEKAGKRNVNDDAVSRNPVVMTVMISSKEKQNKIIKEMHECPNVEHQGVPRTCERLNLYVSWPGMFQDEENYIKNYEIYQKN